jgi:hypothetical protein
MKPRFEHDCDKCLFIGQLRIDEKTTADLYNSCDIGHESYIVRFSDEGADYVCTDNLGRYLGLLK